MENINGQLVLQVLKTFDEPAAFNVIVNIMAEKTGVSKPKYKSFAYLFL